MEISIEQQLSLDNMKTYIHNLKRPYYLNVYSNYNILASLVPHSHGQWSLQGYMCLGGQGTAVVQS